MKIISIVILIIFLSPIKFYGQNSSNMIITIDDKLVVGALANAHLIVKEKDMAKEVIDVNYIPGKLSFKEIDFNKTIGNEDSILLAFDFYEYCNSKQSTYKYEIELKKKWFEYSFLVLRIYNLNKEKNKKIFFPLKGRQYTYEIDGPNGSITRVKKGGYKEKCD